MEIQFSYLHDLESIKKLQEKDNGKCMPKSVKDLDTVDLCVYIYAFTFGTYNITGFSEKSMMSYIFTEPTKKLIDTVVANEKIIREYLN